MTTRARGTLAVVLVLGLAMAGLPGCLSSSQSDAPASEPDAPGDGGTSRTDPGSDGPSSQNGSKVPAPEPPVGRQWTYDAQGAWNDVGEFDVVLARGADGGLVLAGAGPEDLDEEVVHDRPWLGPVDEELNPEEGTTFWDPLFEFPLHDGKTWSWGDGDTVRAASATVETPSGPADGFEMVLEAGDDIAMRWTYAPSVAYITAFTYEFQDTRVLDVQLVDVSSAQEGAWFEVGPEASTNANPEPEDPSVASLEVPEGYDAVVVAAGVLGGGQATVQPPPSNSTEAWTYEGGQEEQWTYEPLPGDEGRWTLQAHREPAQLGGDGYAAVSARAVEWIALEG